SAVRGSEGSSNIARRGAVLDDDPGLPDSARKKTQRSETRVACCMLWVTITMVTSSTSSRRVCSMAEVPERAAERRLPAGDHADAGLPRQDGVPGGGRGTHSSTPGGGALEDDLPEPNCVASSRTGRHR